MSDLPSADAVKGLADLVKLLGDKPALAKAIADLSKATNEHANASASAKAATAKLTDLKQQHEWACAALVEKTDVSIAEREAAYDRRAAERETALVAREQRAATLLKQAEQDAKKAAETRAAIERKMKHGKPPEMKTPADFRKLSFDALRGYRDQLEVSMFGHLAEPRIVSRPRREHEYELIARKEGQAVADALRRQEGAA
jgi:hypothetical protein